MNLFQIPSDRRRSPPTQETEKSKYFNIWKHQRRAVRRAYEIISQSQEGGLTLCAYRKIVALYDPRRSPQDVTLTFLMQDGTPIYSNRHEARQVRESMYFDEDGQPTGALAGDGRLALSELYRFYECSRLRWKLDYNKTVGRSNYEYLPTKYWPKWRLGEFEKRRMACGYSHRYCAPPGGLGGGGARRSAETQARTNSL
jgi:hypothetical protein